MKKIFCFLAIIATFGLINIPSYAAETPVYDGTFNNNQGAFFANGTPIVILKLTEIQPLLGMEGVKLFQIL